MKLRLKRKENHYGERVRLKEQTFLRGLISVHCVSQRNLQTYTRLKSDIFNLTAVVSQQTRAPRVNNFLFFFVKKPLLV